MNAETKALVERLRKPSRAYGYDPVMGADISDGPGSLHVEAADLIERLSAENARLSKEVRLWERMATKSGGQLQQVKDAIQTLHGIALAGEAGDD